MDALTDEEVERRTIETRKHLDAVRALWPGLKRLEEGERKKSKGKTALGMEEPLRALFAALILPPLTHKQETALEPDQRKLRDQQQKLRATFDALGDQDGGVDPDRFEVELLARRLDRMAREQEIARELSDLSRHFGDDALHTGALVAGPGIVAIGLARELARANPAFRSLLAEMTDALRNMTKAARKVSNKRGDGEKAPA